MSHLWYLERILTRIHVPRWINKHGTWNCIDYLIWLLDQVIWATLELLALVRHGICHLGTSSYLTQSSYLVRNSYVLTWRHLRRQQLCSSIHFQILDKLYLKSNHRYDKPSECPISNGTSSMRNWRHALRHVKHCFELFTGVHVSRKLIVSPEDLKNFQGSTHILASTTMMSDQAQVPGWFGHIVVGQKFSDVLLCKLQCTLGRLTFSVILDIVLNLSLNLQKSVSSILEFSTVETTPLFDVFFRGYIAKVED